MTSDVQELISASNAHEEWTKEQMKKMQERGVDARLFVSAFEEQDKLIRLLFKHVIELEKE